MNFTNTDNIKSADSRISFAATIAESFKSRAIVSLILIFTFIISASMCSFADVISDTPVENDSTVDVASSPNNDGNVIYATKKESSADKNNYIVIGNQKTEEQRINELNVINLHFGLVSPKYYYGDNFVAEGSVQLKNGSFAAIDHDYYLRAPYYRLLREETDGNGEAWYIVAMHGSRTGNYHVPGRYVAKELWLKKSECNLTYTIDVGLNHPMRQEIVKVALSLLGKQYKSSGSGPEAFDCSGFVNYVCANAGLTVPRSSYDICAMSNKVDISALKPGDICARRGHVGIYIGNDIFIHACDTSTGVVAERLSVYNKSNGFKYYINAVGD